MLISFVSIVIVSISLMYVAQNRTYSHIQQSNKARLHTRIDKSSKKSETSKNIIHEAEKRFTHIPSLDTKLHNKLKNANKKSKSERKAISTLLRENKYKQRSELEKINHAINALGETQQRKIKNHTYFTTKKLNSKFGSFSNVKDMQNKMKYTVTSDGKKQYNAQDYILKHLNVSLQSLQNTLDEMENNHETGLSTKIARNASLISQLEVNKDSFTEKLDSNILDLTTSTNNAFNDMNSNIETQFTEKQNRLDSNISSLSDQLSNQTSYLDKHISDSLTGTGDCQNTTPTPTPTPTVGTQQNQQSCYGYKKNMEDYISELKTFGTDQLNKVVANESSGMHKMVQQMSEKLQSHRDTINTNITEYTSQFDEALSTSQSDVSKNQAIINENQNIIQNYQSDDYIDETYIPINNLGQHFQHHDSTNDNVLIKSILQSYEESMFESDEFYTRTSETQPYVTLDSVHERLSDFQEKQNKIQNYEYIKDDGLSFQGNNQLRMSEAGHNKFKPDTILIENRDANITTIDGNVHLKGKVIINGAELNISNINNTINDIDSNIDINDRVKKTDFDRDMINKADKTHHHDNNYATSSDLDVLQSNYTYKNDQQIYQIGSNLSGNTFDSNSSGISPSQEVTLTWNDNTTDYTTDYTSMFTPRYVVKSNILSGTNKIPFDNVNWGGVNITTNKNPSYTVEDGSSWSNDQVPRGFTNFNSDSNVVPISCNQAFSTSPTPTITNLGITASNAHITIDSNVSVSIPTPYLYLEGSNVFVSSGGSNNVVTSLKIPWSTSNEQFSINGSNITCPEMVCSSSSI